MRWLFNVLPFFISRFLEVFYIFAYPFLLMAVEQEIAVLVGGEVDGDSSAKVKETVQLAIQQVAKILSETNCTYLSISSALEAATTKVELVAALKIFKPIMRIRVCELVKFFHTNVPYLDSIWSVFG